MRWYFDPRRDHDNPGQDGDSARDLGLPAALLQRHGGRMLNPADAAVVRGWPAPRSTAYRARTLLIPRDLLQGPARAAIDRALAQVGLSIALPGRETEPGDGNRPQRHARGTEPGDRLPVTAVLVPAAAADGQAAVPVVVDAWVALQMLRAAAVSGQEAALGEKAVRRISLEHLLIGSAITGAPISEGGGIGGNPISEGGGVTGPAGPDSYLYLGGDARTPVEVSLEAPARRSAAACAAALGRRPVVAVLDTGARAHPWLGVQPDPAAPGGYGTVSDAFVAVSQDMQDVLHAQAQQAAVAGDEPRHLIRYPWDQPVTADRLIGELDTHTGHGTFIAGIVRQVVPDAQVLSLRVMHSDGIVYEGDLICALSLIADRVAAALEGDMADMIDVISLSLGYFSESAADAAYSSGVLLVIETLTAMGVPVVAAAGNYSTSRRFYPAAFAERPAKAAHAPVISVGALNPNGTQALFSDGGRWVRAWASGAATVSSFPVDVNGSREPAIGLKAGAVRTLPPASGLRPGREALDPDDYSGGFAAWSGTSFAAPQVAGHLARALLEGAQAGQALRLDQPGGAAARHRTASALSDLGWGT